ncbi:hypothetical protein KBY24_12295 [Ruegeria pomeroyi]|nr:hypothetical protein [Ruegeria pomeroyi]MCE8531680.1 hypothetical protein [Ruegeria pomeroyi]MCE8534163.1 hypothetical protein [Ruegeria pomeroyi]
MSKEMRPEPHLLVVGMNSSDVKATMSFARTLLDMLPAIPRGLLVDTRIADLAIGVGHRVVALDGTLREMPTDEQLRRTVKWEASRLETLIADLSSGRSERLSCEVAEGDLITCACAAAADEDILLLCQRPMLGFHGNVLLIGAPNSHSTKVLAMVRALANSSAAKISEVQATEEVAAVFKRVDRSRVAAIVVDLNVGPLKSEEDLRHLFSAARCPVVVIGAKHIKPTCDKADASVT